MFDHSYPSDALPLAQLGWEPVAIDWFGSVPSRENQLSKHQPKMKQQKKTKQNTWARQT